MNEKVYVKILIIMAVVIFCEINIPTIVNAGLQANKGGESLVKTTANDFFVEIRKMETQYGTLGKNANLDTTTYLDSTGNGIDCHMVLNTEYGTAGILVYSEYGSNSNNTTTGNSSGIYNLSNTPKTYVAGIFSNANNYTSVIANSDNRYYNKYISNTPIKGDGLGLFGAKLSWISAGSPIFSRGYGMLNAESSSGGTNSSSTLYYWNSSRAVVVCGSGL